MTRRPLSLLLALLILGASPAAASAELRCEGFFTRAVSPTPMADAAIASAFMKRTIESGAALSLPDALAYATAIMPPGPERSEFQNWIGATGLTDTNGVRNVGRLSQIWRRTDGVIQNGLFRRWAWNVPQTQLTWRLRPVRNEADFIDRVIKAMQVVAATKILQTLSMRSFSYAPSAQRARMLDTAFRLFSWRSAFADAPAIDPDWLHRDPGPTLGALFAAIRFARALVYGSDAVAWRLFAFDRTLWERLRSADHSEIQSALAARYPAPLARLRWARQHFSAIQRVVLVTVTLIVLPETGLTALHQFRIERSVRELPSAERSVREARDLIDRTSADLERALIADTAPGTAATGQDAELLYLLRAAAEPAITAGDTP